MTDDDVARRARAGDDRAFAELLDRLDFLLRIHAKLGLFAHGIETDDFEQAARLTIWKALQRWDPVEGTPFAVYAHAAAWRGAIEVVKTARRKKHLFISDAVSLETRPVGYPGDDDLTLHDCIPAPGDVVDAVIARERLAGLAAALASLSEIERIAFDGFEDGCSHDEIEDEIAAVTGRRSSAVWGDGRASGRPRSKMTENALQRARGKVRAALADAA